jgi:hypothetical protein
MFSGLYSCVKALLVVSADKLQSEGCHKAYPLLDSPDPSKANQTLSLNVPNLVRTGDWPRRAVRDPARGAAEPRGHASHPQRTP